MCARVFNFVKAVRCGGEVTDCPEASKSLKDLIQKVKLCCTSVSIGLGQQNFLLSAKNSDGVN